MVPHLFASVCLFISFVACRGSHQDDGHQCLATDCTIDIDDESSLLARPKGFRQEKIHSRIIGQEISDHGKKMATECSTNYGETKACCGKDYATEEESFHEHMCPSHAPFCVGYHPGQLFGTCESSTREVKQFDESNGAVSVDGTQIPCSTDFGETQACCGKMYHNDEDAKYACPPSHPMCIGYDPNGGLVKRLGTCWRNTDDAIENLLAEVADIQKCIDAEVASIENGLDSAVQGLDSAAQDMQSDKPEFKDGQLQERSISGDSARDYPEPEINIEHGANDRIGQNIEQDDEQELHTFTAKHRSAGKHETSHRVEERPAERPAEADDFKVHHRREDKHTANTNVQSLDKHGKHTQEFAHRRHNETRHGEENHAEVKLYHHSDQPRDGHATDEGSANRNNKERNAGHNGVRMHHHNIHSNSHEVLRKENKQNGTNDRIGEDEDTHSAKYRFDEQFSEHQGRDVHSDRSIHVSAKHDRT